MYRYDKTQTLANRQTMVHLFEWKWTDIANECDNFLQYYGYGAVQSIPVFIPDFQISPPNEHIVLIQNNDVPWWVRYQPVSYKLESRSGNEGQFKEMVDRCNKVGVRIIADVVLNHMVGVSQKFGVNGRSSSGGSDYDGTDGVESFPEVPFNSSEFNDVRCHSDIQDDDYKKNAEHVRSPTVRKKIIEYLDKLIDYGIAGFRFDASKHMWPEDLKSILNGTKDLRSDIFGVNQRPFVLHEVIDRGGEAVKCIDYVGIGRYTNFNFGDAVSSAARGRTDWRSLALIGPGYHYGNGEDHDVVNFIDNHDNQREPNPYVVTYKEADQYKLAVSFMLAWPYGYPRVMSSFNFTHHNQGPPNLGATNNYETTSPTFDNSTQACSEGSGWVCEHRWPSIREMSKFRAAVHGAAAAEIFTDHQRIAFARERKGFFALNGNNAIWNKLFRTTMPPGNYCDHYTGTLANGKCTGRTIIVHDDGMFICLQDLPKFLKEPLRFLTKSSAYFEIRGKEAIAISVASRIGGAPPYPVISSIGYQKTIVFLKKITHQGQNVFIRGGMSHANNDVCSIIPYQQATDKCALPIIHNTTVPFLYTEYLSWSQADEFLDFEGAEEKQGTHDGQIAFGTPLAYSTNNSMDVEYQPYNKYGSDYWMVQLLVNCSKTDNGWFELKGYVTPNIGWEPNVKQKQNCVGSIGGSAPFHSVNHIAKCGAVNVFNWGTDDCIIDAI
ncbi:alpha amylase, catalytic domain protein [Dictyocaulus viviparus]|uniref:Alpha-amylase n=1 Tax=Dictyocaulus viviparus TaxID=29172 RepID=A0A0D8Y0E5_DICVI|nr:alpha amylase, catalytic domain protein [Dictyocaulus viviparus]